MSPRVETNSLCCFPIELLVFCMFLFSFIRLNLFSLNVLFDFKNITREIGIVDYDK